MEIRIKIKPSLANKYTLLNKLLEVACDYADKNADVRGRIVGKN